MLKDRGLIIQDEEKAKFYLAHLNYYRLTAYCIPLYKDRCQPPFVTGASFDDVLNLYIFDRELRLLVLDAIERFEVSLRTQFAYHSSLIQQSAHPHLQSDYYSCIVEYSKYLSKLDGDIGRSKEEFIRHFRKKYSDPAPPIWAVVELMTMGQLSKWFSIIKRPSDRQSIANTYGLDESILKSFCEHITLVRNHTAHHTRLWNREFTVTFKIPSGKKVDANLRQGLIQPSSNNDRRLRKIYNTFVMLAYLMKIVCGENHWKEKLKALMMKHQIDNTSMGFPNDWSYRDIWK